MADGDSCPSTGQPAEMGLKQLQGGGKGSTVLRPRTDVSAPKPLGATSTNGHAKAAAGMVQAAGLLGRIPVVCI